MKKYLLFLFAMLYGSIGAWATPTEFGDGETKSTWEISGSVLTVTYNNASDCAAGSPSISDMSSVTTVKILTGNGVDLSSAMTNNSSGTDMFSAFSGKILDISNATITPVSGSAWVDGVEIHFSYFPFQGHGNDIRFTNIIVPSSLANNLSNVRFTKSYSTDATAVNTYTISGTTVNASLAATSSIAGLNSISSSASTLNIVNDIAGTLDLSSVVVSGNTVDLRELTTGATKDGENNVTNKITVPSGVTVLCSSQGVADRVNGATPTISFNGKASVTTTASSNLEAQLESFLVNRGFLTSNATDEQKTTAFATVTNLTVAGPLTSADLTFLSGLTNLESLNLTGVTSFGTGVSTSTINSAVANTVTVTYPPLFYDYNSTTGVTTITVLEAGNATSANLDAAGVPASVNTVNDKSTIKVVGSVNSTDITNIVARSNSGWKTVRLDFSEATITGSMPRVSGTPDCANPNYIILPPGSDAPTNEEIAYTSSNEHATTNGIYNGYDDLRYIIIPAATAGGHAKIYVNKSKNTPAVIAAIDAYDITVINTNSPSVIDVYNMDDSFDDATFTTLESAINSTWTSPTSVVYHRTSNPIVVSGCNVTIDMNEAGSKTLETLISEAHTAVTTADQSGICTLTVNGPLTAADVSALNAAMGSGNNLASITGLYLGGATGVTQDQVNGLNIPTTLTRLTIPSDRIVAGDLITKAKAATGLNYVYSPTSSSRTVAAQFSPDYVYVLNPGSLSTAVTNEEGLKKGVYIKIATPSGVNLSEDDAKFGSMAIDFTDATNYGWQYIDMSGAGVTAAATLAATAPNSEYGYRIVLPDGLTGDNMAIFASNPNHVKVAAVYSYTGTKLNIMEITDDTYAQTALTDSRIMRSTTTEVEVVSGTYNGATYSAFGNNLLAAINNMGDATNYPSSAGLNVKKVSISTGANVTSPMNFANPTIETLELKNISLAWAVVNVNGCTSLQTLNMNYANVGSVTANVSSLTKVDLSGATINGAADFSNSSLYAESTNGFITDNDTKITGDLSLKSTGLTSFAPKGTYGGDIYLNASNSLASIDVRQMTQTTGKKIHIDKSDTENAENTDVIDALKVADAVTVPTPMLFADHFHPTISDSYIKREAYVPPAYIITDTDMKLHEKEAAANGDHYIYWYQDTENLGKNVTLGTGSTQSLANVLTNNASSLNFSNTTYVTAKIDGPVASTDISSIASINCQVLDLSAATFDADAWAALKTAFKTSSTNVHSNVRFVILPDGSTREDIVNGTALAGLPNVLSVIATEKTADGTNLTTWSRVSGAVQAAVVATGNCSADSWLKTPDGNTARKIYTTNIADFRACKISGLINSHDLSKANQALDANGHLSWTSEPKEMADGETDPRAIDGGYTAYGPFSASFMLSEIDLKEAYFEDKGDNTGLQEEYKRYYCSDMTLSVLGIISRGTYKVVIPQDSRVKEIPADFMNCSTNIRAICIPSNIRAIRTRAFYTIDYVWTTPNENTALDPEGENTKLDNGAKVSQKISENEYGAYTAISATIIDQETGKYIDNPAFTAGHYTGKYETTDGGGTYTFGSNIKLIETGAFANTQPHVTDVYVLNTVAPECHVDAFNTVMYTGNGGYSSISGDQKIITRENYFNNGYWITMLHYPRQTTTPNLQRYTDPTRSYSIATGMRDGKGAPLYFPNQSEFIRAYQQGTYGYIWNAWNPAREYGSVSNGTLTNTTSGWTAANQATANSLFDAYTTGTDHEYTTFYKVSDFADYTVTAPTEAVVPYNQVEWNDLERKYSTVTAGGNLYPQSEVDADTDTDLSGEKTTKDYRGWHQFVLNAYAANTLLEEEPLRSYITDNEWWTFCPTFDITKKQAIELFGDDESKLPYVSRLLYVRREYTDQHIFLNFSSNLMVNKEQRTNATDQHGAKDATTGIVNISGTSGTVDNNDVVMSAGVPYLIKPHRLTNDKGMVINTQYLVFKTQDEANKLKDGTGYKIIVDEDLYDKIEAANGLSGDAQISQIETGLYEVPVFVNGTDITESVKTNDENAPYTYTIGEGDDYQKSTTWHYTFVGSHYLSPLPKNCYYLGKSVANGVTFFYNNYTPYSRNVFRWVNETAVICPTNTAPNFKVTPATGQVPAMWTIEESLPDDWFSVASSRINYYNMEFDSAPVIANTDVVGISEMNSSKSIKEGKVYTVDGQLKGNSLNGLAKGIYIVNGKKHVVK